LANNNLYIPRPSEWFLVIDPAYPLGSIDVYPSKTNSITVTFNHQNLNQPGPEDLLWRSGKLCLDQPIKRLGIIAGCAEPSGDREERLKWHVARAVDWVKAAAAGALVQDGDPFELPYIQSKSNKIVVHDESTQSFSAWTNVRRGDWGVVVWDTIPGLEKTLIAAAFLARDGRIIRAIRRYDEEPHGSTNQGSSTGLWWLWPSPVVLDPWQAPHTWNELRNVGQRIGVDVETSLRMIARSIRDKDANILLLGYPIPDRYGQEPTEIHWEAILLPKLTSQGRPPNGFRPNDLGWWVRDRRGAFSDSKKLPYMSTQNWHPDRMQARGRLEQPLRDSRIALIGCGALGSLLAELLIRGGVADLLLIDHEPLTAGNLVRHTLSGHDIGKNKASALAQRLASVAPFSSICTNENRLPALRGEIEELLGGYNVVIDCTGADEVVSSLGLGWWSFTRLFISASVSYEARRTFIFLHRGHSFPEDKFRARVEPLLKEEKALWAERGEALEGAGCWSPLFPARFDDLFLSAASCIKVIEIFTTEASIEARLIVFEQTSKMGFTGLRRYEFSDAESECSQ